MARRPDRLTSERTSAVVEVNPNGLSQNVIEITCSLISYVGAAVHGFDEGLHGVAVRGECGHGYSLSHVGRGV
jgi:hypothetical protein